MPPANAPTLADSVVRQIVGAYRRGYFPMADLRTGQLHWCSPDVRGVIPLWPDDGLPGPGFTVPRTLRQRVRAGRFVVTADAAFTQVIVNCADPERPGAWIDETIVGAYRLLHDAGYAHSVEAWTVREPTNELVLVGGLYGLSIGGAFFGESMFSRPDLGGADASKVALVHLVAHLRKRGYRLLDTQMWSPHLAQFGCVELPRADFLRRLADAASERSVSWGRFDASTGDAEPLRRTLPPAPRNPDDDRPAG
jgi:leucyl/phenylalanyl-tRNA--protein transferase